ncbi:IS481 family transposase [Litchfieldella qijiaojingensis]|uniref:IS481 family transposase n=1 Tax=Litchfieldella qijiaojingensis TaxID=980347 RepID=A0ABQ2YL54_9GAMM|nr:IS481 family transposase [Halomonas qijiaojingensis]GGX88076.1 IS481 family transposase [Halomonas qijiaojingensis]
MDIKLHKQATTTPKIRAEIQGAPPSISNSELARKYGVADTTVRRWRLRQDTHDRSHTRHNLLATLTPEQEEVLIAAREFLRLGLDDLLVVAREFLNPRLSRSGLHRLLKRREVPTLAELARQDAGESTQPTHKPFRDYAPGFVHVDIKHLPQMPDEERKRYLYVAIDRATRWVYLEVRRSQSAQDARTFMKRVIEKAPFKVQKVLTDNGKSFTDRFTRAGERTPSGQHPFDRMCRAHGIQHRLIKPGRPQTNGMVERFNGRISDVLATRRYVSGEDLEQTLKRYCWLYNHHIAQKALHHQSPIDAMKQWQEMRPDLFHKRVINHPGPDK